MKNIKSFEELNEGTENEPLEKTAYFSWLNRESGGDVNKLASIIKHDVTEDNNPQAWDLLTATGDKSFTQETFLKAAKLIKSLYESVVNEGTMISKRNMDLDEFKSQGSFFNREPHSNDSPVHGKSITELNEDRANDLERELTNVITRFKTKMDKKAISAVLDNLAKAAKNYL
jgi:hypothetical protein